MSRLTSYNILSKRYTLFYKIFYYCFSILIGIKEILFFVFFLVLYTESNYKYTIYLSKQDQQLWFDYVLNPAINKTIRFSNILEYYPATFCITKIDLTTISAKGLAKKQLAREQLLRHTIQLQYLNSL